MDSSSPVPALVLARGEPAGSAGRPGGRDRHGRLPPVPVAIAAVLIAAGFALARAAHVEPSYDAFGWLTWGRQTLLHWNLNTDGAPSWKPLPFLFTLPYAAFGSAQVTLWVLTATTAALGASVFAARIAYRLTGLSDAPISRRWAALVAGAFAGVGVLGMHDLAHQVLIATSDPMVMTLCLAAIDAHLCRRPRLAFAMLVLASLGRPEVWPFAGLSAIWCWTRLPGIRRRAALAAGLLVIPTGWFVIPALTSRSWFIAGQLALHFHGAVQGSKIAGVTGRMLGLYALPVWLAVLAAVALAVARRERQLLVLSAAVAVWLVIEIAFAYHGWPASQRYLMEAGAVSIVLAGVAVGRGLDFALRGGGAAAPAVRPRPGGARSVVALRALTLATLAALAVWMVPLARSHARLVRREIDRASLVAMRIDRLQATVALLGGEAAIKHCGQPVTFVGLQSTLAWNVGLNVGAVGYRPGRAIRRHRPIVLFRPVDLGWQVTPVHVRRSRVGFCRRMFLAYDTGRAEAHRPRS